MIEALDAEQEFTQFVASISAMKDGKLTRRDWIDIGLASFVVLLLLAVVSGVWLLQYAPRTKPLAVRFTPPIAAADVDLLLSHLSKPDRKVGYIPSIWIAALTRLDALGPAAAPFGAVEKLEAFIATAPEGEAKEAAKRTLDKVKGP
jgi:hypothetical protein